MGMTPEVKSKLSKTIRGIRETLPARLGDALEARYRLSLTPDKAALDEEGQRKRQRLQEWIDEQVQTLPAKERKRGEGKKNAERRFRGELVKQAAYTWLNRLVYLRLLEGMGLRKTKLLTGILDSSGYRDFRDSGAQLIGHEDGDDSNGYIPLLQMVFDELALDLPGLFGRTGISELVPMQWATLRQVLEALDHPDLNPEQGGSCWTDDMTLGWVYQYWNDPDREALDAKLNSGGKVAPHEIASKTQMFTERYMVDWLLQNSLGPMWLAMCKHHGWTPHAQSQGVLDNLENRRKDWRAKREAGEVELTALMPLHSPMEQRWAYYVPQPMPDDAPRHAPKTIRELKLLDPAVGSGHFLVVAFELLFALYREEAQHRGEDDDPKWSNKAIVESILENNLHGIDLDPRAVQIAAAALWLKAQQLAPEAQPTRLNLVASQLRLASLPKDDPRRVELREQVDREAGIPKAVTDEVVKALEGADHLGSLLKVGDALDTALKKYTGRAKPQQKNLFGDGPAEPQQTMIEFSTEDAKERLVMGLETFLAAHTGSADLGLRLRGEQLAAGVRFLRLVREGVYDLVVGNPPYQGTSKMVAAGYVKKHYPLGKADLYAAFLERGLEFVREGGIAAQVSMSGWMFLKQYSKLRASILTDFCLRAVVDLRWCAFECMRHNTVAMYSIQNLQKTSTPSVGVSPTPRNEREESKPALHRKIAATLCQVERQSFNVLALKVVPDRPLVYWWKKPWLDQYANYPTLGSEFPVKQGMATANNARFLRKPWEVTWSPPAKLTCKKNTFFRGIWAPYVKGAAGTAWFEMLQDLIEWRRSGLASRIFRGSTAGKNSEYYFHTAVAFTKIGANFTARAYRYPSIFDVAGSSVFLIDSAYAVSMLNSRKAKKVLESLNPTVNFQVGDVQRLPLFPVTGAETIFSVIDRAFTAHEAHREPSVEYKHPGPSPWTHAQAWAQQAVDRPENTPLPPYTEQLEPEPPTDHISFALGVALGRFGFPPAQNLDSATPTIRGGILAEDRVLSGAAVVDLPQAAQARSSAKITRAPTYGTKQGILDPSQDNLDHALPHGILYLDGTLNAESKADSLSHAACTLLHEKWASHGPLIDTKRKLLRDYLRHDFFKNVHRKMYENRPIHWPLSSAKRTFVAWINIHRWHAGTLRVLLAEHLNETLRRLDSELTDLRKTRDGADAKAARNAEKRLLKVTAWQEELTAFIDLVKQCAELGPDGRVDDARYDPDLDDGVMINASALWPLLEPQWRDPKKWWKELVAAKGRKDYDWSHLARRYFRQRVEEKCKQDPSLGVAHSCFWKYHPAKAYAWELRLQDEIAPDFTIDEDGSDDFRAAFEKDHPQEVEDIKQKERKRRLRKLEKAQKAAQAEVMPDA